MHNTEDKIQPLTRIQASDLCQQYQYLNDKQISFNGKQYKIERVTVAPYDDINKWIFLHHYTELRHPLPALNFYHVPFFDVILIVKQDGDGKYGYINLNDYLTADNR